MGMLGQFIQKAREAAYFEDRAGLIAEIRERTDVELLRDLAQDDECDEWIRLASLDRWIALGGVGLSQISAEVIRDWPVSLQIKVVDWARSRERTMAEEAGPARVSGTVEALPSLEFAAWHWKDLLADSP